MSDALLHLGTAPSNEHATSRVLPVAEAIRVWPATDLGFHNEMPQDKLGEELLSPISGNLRIWGKGDVPPAAFQKKKKKKPIGENLCLRSLTSYTSTFSWIYLTLFFQSTQSILRILFHELSQHPEQAAIRSHAWGKEKVERREVQPLGLRMERRLDCLHSDEFSRTRIRFKSLTFVWTVCTIIALCRTWKKRVNSFLRDFVETRYN